MNHPGCFLTLGNCFFNFVGRTSVELIGGLIFGEVKLLFNFRLASGQMVIPLLLLERRRRGVKICFWRGFDFNLCRNGGWHSLSCRATPGMNRFAEHLMTEHGNG